jgi:DNA recombination protein RmuC
MDSISILLGAGSVGIATAVGWHFLSTKNKAALQQKELQLIALQQDLEKAALTLTHERAQAAAKIQSIVDTKELLLAQFQAASKQALQDNNQQFLTLADQVLDKRQQAITHLLTPMKEALGKLEGQSKDIHEKQLGAYSELKEQIKHLNSLQQTVHGETNKLVEAIRRPSVRGRWGEMTLRRVLESAGMLNHCDFVEQNTITTDGVAQRPDVILKLPDKRQIVIDAKVPFEAYLSAIQTNDEQERKVFLQQHGQQLRKHIKDLSSKSYWQSVEPSPEFVILFVPSESAFSAALEADHTLLETGWQQRVVMATPATLMATVMAIAYSWKQERIAESAKQTAQLGRELYERLSTFVGYVNDVGKGLGRAVESYNKAVASYETRLLPKARSFEDLHLTQNGKTAPLIEKIEGEPRLAIVKDEAA